MPPPPYIYAAPLAHSDFPSYSLNMSGVLPQTAGVSGDRNSKDNFGKKNEADG